MFVFLFSLVLLGADGGPPPAPPPAAAPAPAPADPPAPLAGPDEGGLLEDGSPPRTPPPPGFSEMLGPMVVPIAFVFLMMYFGIIRPQKKKEGARRDMLGKIKKSDIVLTTGGLLGQVAQVKGNVLILKVDEDNKIKVRVHRSFVTRVLTPEEEKKEESEATETAAT